jgi:biotin--protein ligase
LTLSASELLASSWQKNAFCLIIPGGEDTAYAEKLNRAGNRIIREYVENGGIFLGICAGAYYASRRIVFDPNGPDDIKAERELGFFPGTVVGPHWAPYVKGHHCGARAVKIHCADHFNTPAWHAYINGGGRLKVDTGWESDVTILAQDDAGIDVMACMPIGEGMAYVSSVHWEYDPHQLFQCCGLDEKKGCWSISDYGLWVADNPHRCSFAKRFWNTIVKNRMDHPPI